MTRYKKNISRCRITIRMIVVRYIDYYDIISWGLWFSACFYLLLASENCNIRSILIPPAAILLVFIIWKYFSHVSLRQCRIADRLLARKYAEKNREKAAIMNHTLFALLIPYALLVLIRIFYA